MLNKYSLNIEEKIKAADILVTATGQTQFISADMLKSGATVIDVTSLKKDNKIALAFWTKNKFIISHNCGHTIKMIYN